MAVDTVSGAAALALAADDEVVALGTDVAELGRANGAGEGGPAAAAPAPQAPPVLELVGAPDVGRVEADDEGDEAPAAEPHHAEQAHPGHLVRRVVVGVRVVVRAQDLVVDRVEREAQQEVGGVALQEEAGPAQAEAADLVRAGEAGAQAPPRHEVGGEAGRVEDQHGHVEVAPQVWVDRVAKVVVRRPDPADAEGVVERHGVRRHGHEDEADGQRHGRRPAVVASHVVPGLVEGVGRGQRQVHGHDREVDFAEQQRELGDQGLGRVAVAGRGRRLDPPAASRRQGEAHEVEPDRLRAEDQVADGPANHEARRVLPQRREPEVEVEHHDRRDDRHERRPEEHVVRVRVHGVLGPVRRMVVRRMLRRLRRTRREGGEGGGGGGVRAAPHPAG